MGIVIIACAKYADEAASKRDYALLNKEVQAGRKGKDDASAFRVQFPGVGDAWFVVLVAEDDQGENRQRAHRLAGMLTGESFLLPPTERQSVIDRYQAIRAGHRRRN